MGIGRREFLRLTGVALAGLFIDPLQAVAVNDNVYVNKKLGILFHKPQEWGFVVVKDFGKLRSNQIIGEGLDMTPEEIWEELGEPICIATKYWQGKEEHKNIFSPTIQLYITPKEEIERDEELAHRCFEEIMALSREGISRILKEFKVVKEYVPYQISNCTFFEYDAEYLFEHIDLAEPLSVELKVLRAEHNGFYYYFNCHQSKAQNQYADQEFEDFKKTIKLI